MLRLFFYGFLMVMVSACGWQLRGSVALSSMVDTLYLTGGNDYGPLMTELRQRLQANDVTLVDGPVGAQYALQVVEETTEKRVAAVGGDALASAYEITLIARFNVLNGGGTELANNLTSRVTRSYNASAGSAGSGAQEEELILGEMRRELSQQILRQLQAAINAAQADEGAPPAVQEPIPTTLGNGDADNGETAP